MFKEAGYDYYINFFRLKEDLYALRQLIETHQQPIQAASPALNYLSKTLVFAIL
jgi:hypothetical protein